MECNMPSIQDGIDEADIEEEDFYNTFKIRLASLQLMFSPYSANWRAALDVIRFLPVI